MKENEQIDDNFKLWFIVFTIFIVLNILSNLDSFNYTIVFIPILYVDKLRLI